MFEEAANAIDALRSSLPFAYLVVVPVLVLIVSPVAVVDAAHEFSVYRMQHYDLQGKPYGCKAAYTNMEARSVNSAVTSLTRKCLILRSKDLTYDKYREAISNSVGTILVLLPRNVSKVDSEDFMALERDLLELQPNIPVYFTYEDEDLTEVYQQFQGFSSNDGTGSALQALLASATSVGYQMVTLNAAKPKPLPNHEIINIEALLAGAGVQEELPTIAVTAYYDTYGVAPFLSHGANSDATGVIAVLEVARILGKLYSNSRTHPKHNVVFLLSGGGKFNYQGTRKWVEDARDNPTTDALQLVSTVNAVFCLDALSSPSPQIRMHVSKPPANNSASYSVFANMQKIAASEKYNINTKMIHKKIRMSADTLAWEHERFSIRRLPAVTFSALDSHEDPSRTSIMDKRDSINVDVLVKNINVLVHGIIQHIYNISSDSGELFSSGSYSVEKDIVVAWLNYLTSHPRPQQDMHKDHAVIKTLEDALAQYTTSVQKTSFKSDESEQDFRFYDQMKVKMSASIVRSAVFDLYLSGIIAAYIACVYFLIMNFESLRIMASKMSSFQKVKVH